MKRLHFNKNHVNNAPITNNANEILKLKSEVQIANDEILRLKTLLKSNSDNYVMQISSLQSILSEQSITIENLKRDNILKEKTLSEKDYVIDSHKKILLEKEELLKDKEVTIRKAEVQVQLLSFPSFKDILEEQGDAIRNNVAQEDKTVRKLSFLSEDQEVPTDLKNLESLKSDESKFIDSELVASKVEDDIDSFEHLEDKLDLQVSSVNVILGNQSLFEEVQ